MTELTERQWTQVRGARCDECGFDPHEFRDRELPAAIRAMGERWVIFVDACVGQRGGDEALRSRSDAERWSPVELACHVRDGLELFAARIERMLGEDQPRLEPWDYEAADVESRYGEQSPHDVAADIGVNADRLAELLEHTPRDSWTRTATLQGHEFTVAGFARFVLHEGYHHLIEAERLTQSVGTS